ncbi:MAG: hypothetical protein ABI082_10090 [Dokdonella sp.]
MRHYATFAALPLLFVTLLTWAGPADWTGQGPFGGRTTRVVVDPATPSRLYATTRNGFFRSVDGGLSWQRAETGLLMGQPLAAQIALDPNAPAALWLVDDHGRLYRSTDGAANWTPTGDTAPAGSYGVTGLGAVVGSPGVLYETGVGMGVRKSVDGGATFTTLAGALVGRDTLRVEVDPANPSRVLAGVATDCQGGSPASSIYRSVDAGVSWSAVVPAGGCVSSYANISFAFGPSGSQRVYAVVESQLLRSDDSALSFSAPGLSATAIAVSPASADVLWLASEDGMGWMFAHSVTRKSIDGGATAITYSSGMTTNGLYVPSTVSIAIHPNYPATPRVWVGTSDAGMFQSSNDGAAWSEQNDGLTATLIRALAVHPNDRTRLYAGVGDAFDPSPAFYRSNSIGGWVPSNSGLGAYEFRTMAIDPTTAGSIGNTVIWGVGYGEDVVGGTATRNGGIYRSSDGGLTWSTLSGGLPTDPLTGGHYAGILRTVALDPRSCTAPPATGPCTTGPLNTAYVTGGGTRVAGNHQWRVMKTTDGGLTWASSENGLPADIPPPPGSFASDYVAGVTPLVIDPVNSQTLYIGTFAAAADGAGNPVSPTVANGVFKSIDGGATWIQKSLGLPHRGGSAVSAFDVLSIAIDPTHPQTLWASTINSNTFGSPGQIFKSTDGAENWTLSNAGVTAPDTRALLVDPTHPSTIYAASGGINSANPGGVYKSTDGGATWNSISIGLPADSALALVLDPVDSRVLHAGTSGGVYTITQLPDADGDGVPDLIENAGPNGGDADGDGTADSVQKNVSTTALGLLGTSGWQHEQSSDVESQTASVRRALDSGTVGGYFTVKLVSGDCTHSVDVTAVDAGKYGADSVGHHGTFDYPRGLVHFELPQCTNAIVDVTFNGANFDSGWSWRYYGPSTPGDTTTMGWHDASALVLSHTAKTWRLNLAAGQFGSYRPAAANSILFVGGPAANETIFSDGFDG